MKYRTINQSIPANHPNLIGTVLIFEFQNLKKSGHSDFQEAKKKYILFCKNLELSCSRLVLTLLNPIVLCNTCSA